MSESRAEETSSPSVGTAAEVAIVTVHFGDPSPTARLLAGIAAQHAANRCRVIVVNNDARPGIAEALAVALAPFEVDLSILQPPRNLYYWAGAQFGLTEITRSSPFPRWLIVCNNDIRIEDRAFLGRLFERDPSRGLVLAPSIVSAETGKDQNPFLRKPFTRGARLKWSVYYSHYWVAKAMLATHAILSWPRARPEGFTAPGPRIDEQEERIYAPHGAFMIFAREFFERGGRLDTNFRMYGEELTVAEGAALLGIDVVYCPGLRVDHDEHATLGGTLTREKYGMEKEAYMYVQSTYWHGPKSGRP